MPAVAQRLTASQRRALHEEATVWERVGDDEFTRLVAKGRPLRVRVRRPLPRVLAIALDAPALNGLKRIARRKQVEARHLAAMWIAERLAREEVENRPRRMA